MLVHMTPDEVANLRNIAEAHGLPFMVNPHTGLPEAGLLGDVFKAIWSGVQTVGRAAINNPQLTAAVVGSTYGAMKGDLSKGLEAGMKAYLGSSLLGGITSSMKGQQAPTVQTPTKPTTAKPELTPWGDVYADKASVTPTVQLPPIQTAPQQVPAPAQGGFWDRVNTGLQNILYQPRPQQGGVPAQGTQPAQGVAQGRQLSPVGQLLMNYGINQLERKYGSTREGTAPSEPIRYRDVRYSRGRVNPRFPEPGQPYWIEGGYEDRGYTTEYPGYTQGPTVQQPNASAPAPYQPYGMAMGGMVPADEGVIPNRNQFYPMANIKSAGYSTATQQPRSAEILGGYDAAVDPFTGEEVKSQSNFADGGTVEDDQNKLKDYFANLRPNAPALARTFGGADLNAGLGGLQGAAPAGSSLQPVAPELADYYRSLLVPPGAKPSRINLDDYFKIAGYKPGPNTTGTRVCPSGQHLDTATMQCVDDTVAPPVTPPVQPCPSGQVRGPSGACEPIPPPEVKTCPAGQVLNKTNGKCEDTAKGCGPGTHLEIVDGVMNCIPDEPQPPSPPKPPPPPKDGCDEGYHKDSKGNCVPDITFDQKCSDGSDPQWDPVTGGFTKCADESKPPPPPPPPPPGPPPSPPPSNKCGVEVIDPDTGDVIVGGAECGCPEGTTRDPQDPTVCKKGAATPPGPTPPPPPPPDKDCASITPNTVFNKATNECECKAGYERNESGNCQKAEVQVTENDDPLWQQVLAGLGWIGRNLGPLELQLAFKAYDELKKGNIITTEKRCRGGAAKIFDADTRTLLCPEDMPNTGGNEYTYRGDSGYSSGCPDPSMMIHLADGGEVAAGELKVGDMVRTVHEKTFEWGDYKVTHKEIVNQPKIEISLDNGKKKVIVSESHRFWTNDKDWVHTADLKKGDSLSGYIVSDMKVLGEGPVVKITVDDAHTYMMEGLFSHNIKMFNPPTSGGPTGRVIVDEPILENAAGGRIKSKRKYATGGIAGLNSGAINLTDGYNFGFAQGGMAAMPEYKAGGKLLRGPGDGMSDDIPAVIRGKTVQRAALADGEFVVPADVVSHLGNGSTDAGAKKLYKMMEQIRRARTGKASQAPRVNTDKFLPRV